MTDADVKPAETPSSSRVNEFGDLRQGTLRGVPFVMARFVLLSLCRVVLRMRVEGISNVPKSGGLLVLSNHLHNADPVLICIASPRPVHFMAKQELMKIPVIGRVIRFAGAFAVDRGRADRAAIRRAIATLDQGIAVGVFPEGTRSRSQQIEKVLAGAGLIALKGESPIVPLAITGSERLPFNGSKSVSRNVSRARRGVTIRFGEPFTLPATVNGKRTTPDMAIDLIMRKIAEMLPESYRGIYSSSLSSSTSTLGSNSSSSSSISGSVSGTTNAPSSS